jgi:hypothetical protein
MKRFHISIAGYQRTSVQRDYGKFSAYRSVPRVLPLSAYLKH